MPILSDDKVIIRAVEPADVDLMYMIENDTRLWDAGNTSVPFSMQVLVEYVKSCSYNFYQDGAVRLAIALPTGMAVGFVDLQNYDARSQRAELGIVLMPECQHMGLGLRVLHLMSGYASRQLHLHQIYAHVQSGNVAAMRLFRSAGYQQTGVLRQWVHCQEGWRDVTVFQMLL